MKYIKLFKIVVKERETSFSPISILMVAGVWLLALVGTGVCVYLIVKKPKQRDNK